MSEMTNAIVTRRTTGDDGAGKAIEPRVAVEVRAATDADVPFVDKLQKANSKELGFLPTQALVGKVTLGQVLIAEVAGRAAGYLIAADRYQKRDEVGYVTQVNVVPEHRRHLVAAALLQAQFDRSAYGCRLYCCWCAQDLKANEFWEAMGFVPIAFRTGSRTKGKGGTPRIHIFWQKRVRAGDASTAWWYPSVTGGGELREDRLVFPIPAGVGWRDVLPTVLTGGDGAPLLPGAEGDAAAVKPRRAARPKRPKVRITRRPRGPRMRGGLWFAHDLVEVFEREEAGQWVEFGDPGELGTLKLEDVGGETPKPGDEGKATDAESKPAKPARPPIDPRLLSMARELRDRWAERADALPEPDARYDLRRRLSGATTIGPSLPGPAAPLALPQAA